MLALGEKVEAAKGGSAFTFTPLGDCRGLRAARMGSTAVPGVPLVKGTRGVPAGAAVVASGANTRLGERSPVAPAPSRPGIRLFMAIRGEVNLTASADMGAEEASAEEGAELCSRSKG